MNEQDMLWMVEKMQCFMKNSALDTSPSKNRSSRNCRQKLCHHQLGISFINSKEFFKITGAVKISQLLGSFMLRSPSRFRLPFWWCRGTIGIRIIFQHRVFQNILFSFDRCQNFCGHTTRGNIQVLLPQDVLDAPWTTKRHRQRHSILRNYSQYTTKKFKNHRHWIILIFYYSCWHFKKVGGRRRQTAAATC